MWDRSQLEAKGRRAYEYGRLLSAARLSLYVLPLSGLCLLATHQCRACPFVGVALLIVGVWVRWRVRGGSEEVNAGIAAGSVPLIAGIVLARETSYCGSTLCAVACAVLGVAAGAWLAARACCGESPLRWLRASGIAVLAASLGGISLSPIGAAGVLLGVSFAGGARALFSGWR